MYPPQLVVANAKDKDGGDEAEPLCSTCGKYRIHCKGYLVGM